MLAQSFKHGCLKAAALSRYARMHKDSHTKPLHDATAQMAVDAQMQRPKRPQTQGCLKSAALSCHTMWQPKRLTRHGCETNRASTTCKDARWRSHKVGARTRRPQRPHFDKPRYTFARSTSGVLFFWCGGWENPQLAGKARMPYKMNAQSFKQGCLKSAAQSRYARMHKDSHTEPLHDATAQMAVIAQMQRHKWLSMHRCGNPNG